ncbi:MAG: M23 family metallopeptidase [Calditrichaeota bacterium]|nr:M23 family metallopeptidase [Calditrichota bacterium]
MFKILLLPLLFFSTFLPAQNYLWPTNASRALSSSFCEYRPGHYHAAIDIKTWNKEGYKCFAIEDGIIERIKISPFGAGKALYLKLKDGRKAVYFHLQKFTKELEQKIGERQRAEKSYSIEWWPKNLKVKKGEIIAYTGQTGIGVPHLHFEIRDEQNRPLNPLQFYSVVKDKIRPNLKQLLIIPQNESSSVNGSFKPQIFPLSHIHEGVYIIKEPIFAQGLLGLAINGFDQADGFYNKLGFYKSTLSQENNPIFEQAYDRLNFKNTRMVDIDIYYPEKARSKKRFNKLFLDSFNNLGFYNRKLGNGLINVLDDTVNFEISIEDYFQNRSIIKGNILPGELNSAKINRVQLSSENAYLKMTIPTKINNLQFFSGKSADSLKEISYYEIMERTIDSLETVLLLKIRLAEQGDFLLQTILENSFGQTTKTIALLNNENKNLPTSQVELYGKQLFLSFNNIADSEKLTLKVFHDSTNNDNRLNIDDNVSEYVFPAKKFKSDSIKITMQDLNKVYFDTLISAHLLLPNKTQKYSFYHDSLKLSSTVKTVYDTLFFSIDKDSANPEQFELPAFGSIYKMSIGDQILNRTIELSLKSDSSFFPDGQASIYSVGKKGLNFVGGKYNPQTGYISTRIKTFAKYIIAADTIAPQIEIQKPRWGKTYKKMPQIIFKAVDEISEIGSDKNIEIYFNDEYVVPEWDFETNIVKGRLHYEPQKGKHKVTIKVKDRAGNITQKVSAFSIN